MTTSLLYFDSFVLRPTAVGTLLSAVLIVTLSALAIHRERGSTAVAPYANVSLTILIWIACSTGHYAATDAETALLWAKLAGSGAVFLPAAGLWFAATLVGRTAFAKFYVRSAYLMSALFLFSIWVSGHFTTAVTLHAWGWYPVYGTAGWLFVLYSGLVVASIITVLLRAHRATLPGASSRRRGGLLLLAMTFAALSAVDFLPALGLPGYPAGYLMVLGFMVTISRLIGSYYLVDITPALAGQTIIDTIREALIAVDEEGIIRMVNPAARKLLWRTEHELLGSRFSDHFAVPGSQAWQALALSGHTTEDLETVYRAPQGDMRTVSIAASPLTGRGNKVIALLYVLQDITERKQAEEKIRFLAYNDALTGLPNRIQFDERLQRALVDGKCEAVTTLFVDLDRFKRVNDTLGHNAGDELLAAAANRLRQSVRQASSNSREAESIIARIGGDEFVIALFGMCGIGDIRRIAQRIIDRLADPFVIYDEEIFIGASVGVSIFPRDGTDAETLLRNADRAMYHAKQAGCASFHFYNSTMDDTSSERLQLEKDLRLAIDNDEFELHFQPQIDVRSRQVSRCEALLRWRHPVRGMIPPMEFIPLAEEDGSISQIGEWVLRQACLQARTWHDAGLWDFKIAVNVSPRQFRRGNLVAVVDDALRDANLEPHHLELELTESLIMENAAQTIVTLQELKARGVSIAVDDFGTGYSSLSYLKRFPIDVIKIDQSFVRDIATDPEDAAVINAIIAMTDSLKRSVIAEGVETREQADFLQERGCHMMQGYLFGKPCTPDEFVRQLSHAPESGGAQGNVVSFQPAGGWFEPC